MQNNDDQFLWSVREELTRARGKFPPPNATFAALVEEVGEVAKALMYESREHVVAECVQVAAMAARIATEGDCTMVEWRKSHAPAAEPPAPIREQFPDFLQVSIVRIFDGAWSIRFLGEEMGVLHLERLMSQDAARQLAGDLERILNSPLPSQRASQSTPGESA